MDDRDVQVGWTEAQWNRVREEVLRAWQRVRVAGSVLPVYGPLPPSTQVVPSEIFKADGTVDDQATAVLLEISLPVRLTRQEIREEDLSSALLQFRRRAAQVGQLEDWYILNGTYPTVGVPGNQTFSVEEKAGLPSYRPSSSYLRPVVEREWPFLRGVPKPITIYSTQMEGLGQRNPGALGLIEGPRVAREVAEGRASRTAGTKRAMDPKLTNDRLIRAVVQAISSLEERGYVPPYACILGRGPFEAAHDRINNSTVTPRDRLEPLIGRELLHAGAIDIRPVKLNGYEPTVSQWQNRGVLLSAADGAVDLAIAAEATPEFRQVEVDGRYVFSVFERFTLRVKDANAIEPLNLG
jgi:uncharacterized linocin/CFP29 family protein